MSTRPRPCSRAGCRHDAVATLTFVYADSTAVLGPMSQSREPHGYDLCEVHAERLSAPKGWQVIRHSVIGEGSDFGETSAIGEVGSGA